jgi:hypothetical protein
MLYVVYMIGQTYEVIFHPARGRADRPPKQKRAPIHHTVSLGYTQKSTKNMLHTNAAGTTSSWSRYMLLEYMRAMTT